MRVQTEEWRRFIPGVRMYKGKKTFFYNGERLTSRGFLIYDWEERQTWEVVIVLPGVEIIPRGTFFRCWKLKTVIMADTVRRIERAAFEECWLIEFVKLSRDIEFIGLHAFLDCKLLTSIFIPPSCREIDENAFWGCERLIILGLPQDVQLGTGVFQTTELIKKSPIEIDERGYYNQNIDHEEAVQWIKSINNEEAYALHRACASYNPLAEITHDLIKRQGIKAMKIPNAIGITPSQYLEANTFAEISEKDLINRYISDMMGEVI